MLLGALGWGGIAACGFSALVNTSVHVVGNTIGGTSRDHLRDEVLIGNMTPWELALVTSPVGRIRAISPLRQELTKLRAEVSRSMGGARGGE